MVDLKINNNTDYFFHSAFLLFFCKIRNAFRHFLLLIRSSRCGWHRFRNFYRFQDPTGLFLPVRIPECSSQPDRDESRTLQQMGIRAVKRQAGFPFQSPEQHPVPAVFQEEGIQLGKMPVDFSVVRNSLPLCVAFSGEP